ncbi:hypothetical protein HZS_5716 [Henneguya salminicola]|nr:hypothetical protein HZS_5716 [Henneguya salminicola]
MAPNFVFNGRSYIKKLTKTNGEHNCEANRLVIQIPVTNLFFATLISEKVSQLNLYLNQIFRDLLLTMSDQFVLTPYSIPSKNQRAARFNRNEFDRSSYASSIKSSSIQPTFFPSLLGGRYSWS